jgi:hypothetical protein
MSVTEQLTPRQIIDPEGTLPDVELVPDDEAQKHNEDYSRAHTIQYDGEKVGVADIDEHPGEGHSFGFLKLEDEHLKEGAKKGYGLAAYLIAVERAHAAGEVFRTGDTTLSPKAKRVWDKFIDRGVAQVVKPFEEDIRIAERGNIVLSYKGSAEIRPPKA